MKKIEEIEERVQEVAEHSCHRHCGLVKKIMCAAHFTIAVATMSMAIATLCRAERIHRDVRRLERDLHGHKHHLL